MYYSMLCRMISVCIYAYICICNYGYLVFHVLSVPVIVGFLCFVWRDRSPAPAEKQACCFNTAASLK